MLKMHMTCGYVLVVKPFEVIFTSRGRFAKMMAGTYMGDFVGFSHFLKIRPCSLKTPPSRHGVDYGASPSRSNTSGKIDEKKYSGITAGLMAVDGAKL